MSKYKDIEKIGSGGFGVIFRCERDSSGEHFAKKTLDEGADKDSIVRFRREVRLLASLDHPNIVKVIGKRLQDPPLFYVMPLYRGSLQTELSSVVGRPERIGPIFSAILEGVEHAHKEGVIHRDLKPDNVLMNSDEDIVVSDFGLGRQIDSESTRKTITGFGMGTLYYTAPEQFLNAKDADERSDIFSLGQILYAMYTGPLVSPVHDLDLLPPGIRLIVQQCTRQDPDRRFQDVSLLKTAFSEVFEVRDVESSINDLHKLATKLSAPGDLSARDAARFIRLLVEYAQDPDLLHEIVMQLDASMVALLYDSDHDSVRALLIQFVRAFRSQGWGFSVTDRICDRCTAILEHLDDPEIHAEIIVGLMVMGVDHNRFYVLEQFGDLITHISINGVIDALRPRLREIDDRVRERAAKYAPLGKLPQPLRKFFDFEP